MRVSDAHLHTKLPSATSYLIYVELAAGIPVRQRGVARPWKIDVAGDLKGTRHAAFRSTALPELI